MTLFIYVLIYLTMTLSSDAQKLTSQLGHALNIY